MIVVEVGVVKVHVAAAVEVLRKKERQDKISSSPKLMVF
jgi:hypothetical protein